MDFVLRRLRRNALVLLTPRGFRLFVHFGLVAVLRSLRCGVV
jgi:hypothetical protein